MLRAYNSDLTFYMPGSRGVLGINSIIISVRINLPDFT